MDQQSGGGWWRQLSSPRSYLPGATRRQAGLTSSTNLLYLSILLISSAWLYFEFSLIPKHSQDQLPIGLSRSLLFEHPRILKQTQQSGDPGVGYVEAVIPDSILEVIKDDDDTDQASLVGEVQQQQPSETNSTSDVPENLYDFEPDRLSPILRGRTDRPKPLSAMPMTPADLSEPDKFSLIWDYGQEDKLIPYVGNSEFLKQFDSQKERRAYLNSLATFPLSTNGDASFPRYHGRVGIYPNGTQLWTPDPMPPPIDKVNATEVLKRGGFYLKLANALPLDRKPDDNRQSICKKGGWDYKTMEDASVVITFYNEPLATLLRTVHSVLNNTPPPLLREIILVDDHSSLPENTPGDDLYEYIKLLPKTKILRLPERRGLVWARLAGAHAAQGKVLVVLDSHVEVNPGWLEPQLARLAESPKSVVFPQILALEPRDFSYHQDRGIGCWLSWKWNMVEQASLTGKLENDDPIPSPSMAGGLFAVRLDWFWEVGGYDEGFAMWGSENVEMGFRVWMCGGRMECTPCALTYHIYRDGGVGYSSPDKSVHVNKIRTARLWMDEHWLIAREFVKTDTPIGDVRGILDLKKRLQCKSFKWFLDNVDPTHDFQSVSDVEFFGELRLKNSVLCLDSLSHEIGGTYGTYWCHKHGGTQKWLKDKKRTKIRSGANDGNCLGAKREAKDGALDTQIVHCSDADRSEGWKYDSKTQQLKFTPEGSKKEYCLTAIDRKELAQLLACDDESEDQRWEFDEWKPPPFEPVSESLN